MGMDIGRHPIGSDHRLGAAQDALHIALVHHEIDGTRRPQRLDRVALRNTHLGRDLGQLPPGQLGPRRAPADQRPARGRPRPRIQHRRARRVRIGVEPDRLPRAGPGDPLQRFAAAPMVRNAGDLVVRDHQRQPGFLGDPDRLVDRVEHMIGLVTDMRGVDPATDSRAPGQLHHLRRRRSGCQRIEEPARKPGSAGRHGRIHQRFHRGDLVRARRPVQPVHHRRAQRSVPHQRNHVGGRPCGAQSIQPVPEPGKAEPGRVRNRIQRRRRPHPFRKRQRRQAQPAIPGHDRRHALADLGLQQPLQQRGVVVRVRVDETRRQRQAIRVHHPVGRPALQPADTHDPIPAYGHRAVGGRRARPVDQACIADDLVGVHPASLVWQFRYETPFP